MSQLQKISIITVCYNSEQTIADTLISVSKQTYPAIEYIVIDGGSKDGTLAILNSYRERIDCLVSEPDRGIYDAYNKGFLRSSGDVIYYLNSDDYLHDPDVIADVMEHFNRDGQLAFLAADVVQFDEATNYQRVLKSDYTVEHIYDGYVPQCPAFFARRAMYEKHGLYSLDYKISSDYEWIVKCYLSDYERSLYLPRNISMFRLGGVSTTDANHELLWQEKLRILELFFGREHVERFQQSQPRYVFEQFWRTHDRSLAATLMNENEIRTVAVFGTLEAAECLFTDLRRCGVGTVAFLDNDIRKQGTQWHGVGVFAPHWLQAHAGTIDAVIISVQREQVDDLRAQLAALSAPHKPSIFSYYEIVQQARRARGEQR